MNTSRIGVVRLGRTDYEPAWRLQRRLVALRSAGAIGDALLLTEHEHVYTLGTTGDANHLLAGPEELRTRGAKVYAVERGGDVTYHGPGQIVGYPILDLNGYYLDLHRYLRDLEEVVIRTLADYGITGTRDAEFTGVWAGTAKIAALGVKVSRWVTMHGFALNVSTDLSYFDRIIPCGIFHKGVTSMEQLLGARVPIAEVSDGLAKHFAGVFGAEIEEITAEALTQQAQLSSTESSTWHQ